MRRPIFGALCALLVFLFSFPAVAAPGDFTTYTLPVIPDTPRGPWGIAYGPDGNLWSTEYGGNAINRMTPAGDFTRFPLPDWAPNPPPMPTEIIAAKDGGLWFASNSGVARISTTGVITQYTGMGYPNSIVDGPDNTLWISGYGGQSIFQMTYTGTLTSIVTPGGTIRDMVFSSPDVLWFAQYSDTAVGRLTISTKQVDIFDLGAEFGPSALVLGLDGNIWVGNEINEGLARITPNGTVAHFPTERGITIRDMTIGPDGYVWLTENGRNKIARVWPNGTIREYTMPNPAGLPIGITRGPDDTLWVVDSQGASILRFEVPPIFKAYTPLIRR